MQTNTIATTVPAPPTGWRFKVGVALFAWIILSWLLLPIEAALGMSGTTIGATTAVLLVGNKVVFVIATAVMGKAGFLTLKAKVFHQLTPPAKVSVTRYRIGLVMFFLPFLLSLVETWGSHIAPHLVQNRLWVDVAMDGMLIGSLFVLGGSFWEKLRALFLVDAVATLPLDSSPSAAATHP
jgi:hypothetical protein